MSENPSIVECLSIAMEAIRAVGKTGKNAQQNYNFRGIDAVVNAASPAFRKVGVVVTPDLRSVDYEAVEVGNKRSLMQSCKVVVAYTFHGPAGDSITAVAPGEAMDSGDKATAKAMSVAFRTALLQSLCIPTTESDPDEQAYERSPRPQRPPAPLPLLSEAERHEIEAAIGALDDAAEARLREQWKARRIRPLDELLADDLDAVRALIVEIKTGAAA